MPSIFRTHSFDRWVVTHSLAVFNFHDHRPTVLMNLRLLWYRLNSLVTPFSPTNSSSHIAWPAYQVLPTKNLCYFRMAFKTSWSNTILHFCIIHLEFENRMKSLNSKTANHLLYQMKLVSSCYPERYFGGNQLLGCSMSLSPLYSTLTSDLHVSTVRRSSIKVSFDFYHVKYRSQPFGSCRFCSRSWPPCLVTCVQHLLARRALYVPNTFITLSICNRFTCTSGKFLGPCFKTGRNQHILCYYCCGIP